MRKVAARSKETHRAEAFGKGTLIGGAAAGLGSQLGSLGLVKSVKPTEAAPPVERLKALLGTPDIKVKPTEGNLHGKLHWLKSHYMPDKVLGQPTGMGEYVMAPTKSGGEILAHELGHASLRGGKGVGRFSRLLGAAGNLRNPIMGFGALGGTAMALAPEDPNSTVVKAAPYVTGAAMVPTLADEAVASLKGLKALKGAGYSPEMLRAARWNLAKTFGTYGLAAGAAVLPVALAAYIRRRRAEEDALKASA